MTEKELLSNVIETAHIFGWKVAHFRSVPVKRGKRTVWETPVQADGKGFPDLCMVRERVIFAELKVGKNKTSPEQTEWLALLLAAGVEAYLWTEAQWLSGTVEEVLRQRTLDNPLGLSMDELERLRKTGGICDTI